MALIRETAKTKIILRLELERMLALPVNVVGVLAVVLVPGSVELSVVHEVKVRFPRLACKVLASLKWIMSKTVVAVVTLVAQNSMVKLSAVAAPLHVGVAKVPSKEA